LGIEARGQLLKAVQKGWVQDQIRYPRGQKQENRGWGSVWHHWGWVFALAGLINVLAMLLAELSFNVHHVIDPSNMKVLGCLLGAGLAILIGSLILGAGKCAEWTHHGPYPNKMFLVWALCRPVLWGWALVVAWVTISAPTLLEFICCGLKYHPAHYGFWIITTGLNFLSRALCFAWRELNFLSEFAHQNQALEGLYSRADKQLTVLIAEYLDEANSDPNTTLEAIQCILFQLGGEALDENTDWLILHRTRPLEPFVAA
jgi:hypothetical protein